MIYLLAINSRLLKGQSAGLLARWLDKNWTNCPPTDLWLVLSYLNPFFYNSKFLHIFLVLIVNIFIVPINLATLLALPINLVVVQMQKHNPFVVSFILFLFRHSHYNFRYHLDCILLRFHHLCNNNVVMLHRQDRPTVDNVYS